jgi:hypothetical protein
MSSRPRRSVRAGLAHPHFVDAVNFSMICAAEGNERRTQCFGMRCGCRDKGRAARRRLR